MKKSITVSKCLALLVAAVLSPHGNSAPTSIAFLEGFTGEDPNTARELYRGTEVFFQLHPEARHRFVLTKWDTQGKPEQAYQIIKRLAEQGVKVAIGISKSDEAIAAAKAADEKGVLFVTPYATNEEVTRNRKMTFRTCYSDPAQGRALADFVSTYLRPKRLLILVNGSLKYSQGLAGIVESELRDSKTKTRSLIYSTDDLRLSEVVTAVKDFEPSAVFIPDHIIRASLLAREIHRFAPEITFVGADGWGGKKTFRAILGPVGTMRIYYSTHWAEGFAGSENKRFEAGYKRLFPGDSPTSGAALAYDTMQLFERAFKRLQVNERANAELLVKRISSLSLVGASGPISFAGGRRSPRRGVFIVHPTDSEYKVVEVVSGE